MSEKNHISEAEQLLKDQLSGLSTPPPPQVWSGIESQFPAASPSAFTQIVEWFKSGWKIKSAAIIGTVATISYFAATDTTSEEESTPQTEVIEQNSPESALESEESLQTPGQTEPTSSSEKTRDVEQASAASETKAGPGLVRTHDGNKPDAPDNASASPASPVSPVSSQDDSPQRGMLRLVPDDTTICEGDRFSVRLPNEEALLTCWYLNGDRTSIRKRSFPVTGGKRTVMKVSADVIQHGEVVKLSSTVRIVQRPQKLKIEKLENGYRLVAPGNDVTWTNKNGMTTGSNSNTLIWDRSESVFAWVVEQGCTTKLEFVPPPEQVEPIKWINIPNVFTPNNDGLNDEFVIQAENARSMTVVIRDLNGQVVYQTRRIDGRWDGTNMTTGKPCDAGKYLVQIRATNNNNETETKTTSLILVRDN